MADENALFAKTEEFDVESALSDEIHDTEEEKYLLFRSDGILYGVQVDFVKEILTEVAVTKIPMTPEYVLGVINLRGLIPPIIDFRLLLGQYPPDKNCAIMLEIEGVTVGIMVDGVDQTVDVQKSTILPVPTQRGNPLICGMCTMPGSSNTLGSSSTNTVMLMDAPALLHVQ